jgi:uroporphyrin-III C-methyltransferase
MGSIALVGAGPGDPDLLTIQAMKLLDQASLVIADRLIAKEILQLVKCELKIANKKPGCAEEAQEEIYEWVKQAVREGKNVVRLKIGDPYLFGRGGEEVLEYRKELGIEPIVAPGLSSSYVAPLVAKIPLTHRDVSNHVVISTGYGKNGSTVDVPNYNEERTVVLLMAIGRLNEIIEMMKGKGYPLDTPVAIIENASTPRERVLLGSVESICEIAKKQEAKPPAIIVVGRVVGVL